MSNKKSTPQNQEPKYTLERILGEGSSATVYLGTDEKGNSVVIKQFKNSILNTHYKEKVEREIETLRQINHPQIPKYLDYFEKVIEKRRLPHLVMEYKEGPTLEKYLNDNRLQIEQISHILKEILLLLQYIHSLQPALIHRDIKPSNMIIQENTPPNIILIDFGIAVDDIQKTFGHTLNAGTLSYRAPEQVRGEPLIQSDLYSVGVIAFEMLTKTSAKTVFLNLENNLWQRKFLQTKLSTKWYRWLEKMLDTNPKSRFSSAKEAIQKLPEVDLQQSKKQIKRANQLAQAPKPMEIPKEDFVQDALSQLQQEAERQKLEKIAKELKKKEQERIRKETEERRKIEEELKTKERRRITRERQQQIEEKRRKKEEAIQRKKEEAQRRKTAIENYQQYVEQNVAMIWDQMIQQIVADELDVKRVMEAFVESVKEKMTFVYKTPLGKEERIPIIIVEFELAKTYPKIETDVLSQYVKKIQNIVTKKFESTDDFRRNKKKIDKWKSKISTWEDGISQKKEGKKNLAFWESWLGKNKPIDAEIAKYEGETQKLQKQIQKIQAQQSKALEQQIQVYMFDLPVTRAILLGLPFDEHKIGYSKGDFYVMTTQVTQKFWKKIIGKNPSHFRGDDLPVENVSWFDCVIFANLLSEKLGLEKVYEIPKELTLGSSQSDYLAKKVKVNTLANGYRLPTEGEWKYAARGGKNYTYAGSNNLDEVGWYDDNSGHLTHCVGQKKSNGYGLYDMSGNVFEWCFYAYDSTYRVGRGGSWGNVANACRVSARSWLSPSDRSSDFGVRFFRSVPQDS